MNTDIVTNKNLQCTHYSFHLRVSFRMTLSPSSTERISCYENVYMGFKWNTFTAVLIDEIKCHCIHVFYNFVFVTWCYA